MQHLPHRGSPPQPAPFADQCFTVARPIPLAPPVTIAILLRSNSILDTTAAATVSLPLDAIGGEWADGATVSSRGALRGPTKPRPPLQDRYEFHQGSGTTE